MVAAAGNMRTLAMAVLMHEVSVFVHYVRILVS